MSTRGLLAAITGQVAFGTLVILALTFPIERQRPFATVSTLVFTNTEALVVIVLCLWLIWCLLGGRRPEVPRSLVTPVALWLAVLAVSALLAPSRQEDAIKFVGRCLAGALVGWAAYDMARFVESLPPDAGRIRRLPAPRLLRSMAIAGIIVTLVGLAEIGDIGPVNVWLASFKAAPTRVGDVVRLSSTLEYATIAAMMLELTLPLILAWLLMSRGEVQRMLLASGLALSMLALILTLTRAAIIALTMSLVLAAWLAWQRHRVISMANLVCIAGFALLAGLLLVVNPRVRLRLDSETERAWYQATYQVVDRLEAQPGQVITVPITVTNTGLRLWQSDGLQPFHLGYHVRSLEQALVVYDGVRTRLDYPVPSQGSLAVIARLVAPSAPGNYLIEWDMVQEAVTWFSWKGSPVGQTHLVVSGPAAALFESTAAASPMPVNMHITQVAPGRIELWQAAWRMFLAHPLLGIGPDNFRLVYGQYAGKERWDESIHANSIYIEWLADTGIVGLLAFLWMSWRLMRVVFSAALAGRYGSGTRNDWLWLLAVTTALIAWFIHGVFDYFYEFTATYVGFWLLVGLAARAAEAISRGEE